jgi:hypothetical protein
MSEKRKKSWREIDRKKDRSAHRQEEPAAGRGRRRSPAGQSRSHRAALDRLFDSGGIGDLVRKQDEQTGRAPDGESKGPSRRQLQQAIEKATQRDERIRAMDAYLAAYSLVGDFELLGLMLEHPDTDVVQQAMDLLEELLQREKPRRPGGLRAQLRNIEELGEVATLRRRAEHLLGLL